MNGRPEDREHRTNIDEIAKKARVSRATVSRVLNNFPGVKEKTRDAVLAVINESNYIPNAAARTLASKRSNVVGVLVSNLTQPFWSGIISGIEDRVKQADYGLFLSNSRSLLNHGDYSKEYKKNLRELVLRGVDGIIISMSSDIEMDDVEFLEGAGLPYVVVQNNLPGDRIACVNVDNVAGACTATEYLVGLGHRDIIHAASTLGNEIGRARIQGFVNAMERAGLPVDNGSVLPCGSLFTDGYWLLKRLLSEAKRPTAVLFSNDNTAYGACLAVMESGLKIPDDISIMGFDGLASEMDIARLLPDLSTMNQPVLDIGEAAARMLLEQLEGSLAQRSVLLPLELHKGKTCGAPRA